MKLVAIFAVNALIVGAGILTYDVIRADPAPVGAAAETGSVDLSPVLGRLDALERRLDGIDTTSERRLSTRLLQLEQRVGALATDDVAAPGVAATTASPASAEAAAAPGAAADGAPLDDREVARVREALEQVETERGRARAGRMADGLVDRLDLSLTDEQRERLGEELGKFRESMREYFRSSRSAGLSREEARAGMDEKRGELVETLGAFLSASDAEAIVAEVGNGPGGGAGGARGGARGGTRGGGFGGGR